LDLCGLVPSLEIQLVELGPLCPYFLFVKKISAPVRFFDLTIYCLFAFFDLVFLSPFIFLLFSLLFCSCIFCSCDFISNLPQLNLYPNPHLRHPDPVPRLISALGAPRHDQGSDTPTTLRRKHTDERRAEHTSKQQSELTGGGWSAQFYESLLKIGFRGSQSLQAQEYPFALWVFKLGISLEDRLRFSYRDQY
jgi:hypothetical protein